VVEEQDELDHHQHDTDGGEQVEDRVAQTIRNRSPGGAPRVASPQEQRRLQHCKNQQTAGGGDEHRSLIVGKRAIGGEVPDVALDEHGGHDWRRAQDGKDDEDPDQAEGPARHAPRGEVEHPAQKQEERGIREQRGALVALAQDAHRDRSEGERVDGKADQTRAFGSRLRRGLRRQDRHWTTPVRARYTRPTAS